MPDASANPSPSPTPASPQDSGPTVPPRPTPWNEPPSRWASLRARLDDPRVVLALLVLLGVVAGFVWLRWGTPTNGAPIPKADPTGRAARSMAVPDRATRRTVVAHIAGAVARPGIVRVPDGARVVDAIAAAGGARADADLDQLNLAARIADGERVLVPVRGAAPSPVASATGVPVGRLHLNGATLEQLDALPGIGPTLAAAILRARDRRGGFRSTADLAAVPGIGDARLAQLEPLVAP